MSSPSPSDSSPPTNAHDYDGDVEMFSSSSGSPPTFFPLDPQRMRRVGSQYPVPIAWDQSSAGDSVRSFQVQARPPDRTVNERGRQAGQRSFIERDDRRSSDSGGTVYRRRVRRTYSPSGADYEGSPSSMGSAGYVGQRPFDPASRNEARRRETDPPASNTNSREAAQSSRRRPLPTQHVGYEGGQLYFPGTGTCDEPDSYTYESDWDSEMDDGYPVQRS
nr:uncharacterized protein CI109_005846 [Kwoniella shandongensis]KAA5525823.1 hypothetical protein CI109_005846 [Kwoniella shandongensis]